VVVCVALGLLLRVHRESCDAAAEQTL